MKSLMTTCRSTENPVTPVSCSYECASTIGRTNVCGFVSRYRYRCAPVSNRTKEGTADPGRDAQLFWHVEIFSRVWLIVRRWFSRDDGIFQIFKLVVVHFQSSRFTSRNQELKRKRNGSNFTLLLLLFDVS